MKQRKRNRDRKKDRETDRERQRQRDGREEQEGKKEGREKGSIKCGRQERTPFSIRKFSSFRVLANSLTEKLNMNWFPTPAVAAHWSYISSMYSS